jgi:hypothetical protein
MKERRMLYWPGARRPARSSLTSGDSWILQVRFHDAPPLKVNKEPPMVRIISVIVLTATCAWGGLVPRHGCRPQCQRIIQAANVLPEQFAPQLPACDAKHPRGTPKCLRILVRHCRHHLEDCAIPWPTTTTTTTSLPECDPRTGGGPLCTTTTTVPTVVVIPCYTVPPDQYLACCCRYGFDGGCTLPPSAYCGSPSGAFE